jgi:hypothetical protein
MMVNQIRVFGDTKKEKICGGERLRSLTPEFDHMVATIEDFKDLSTYIFDELMGSLQVREARLNRSKEKDDSYAFLTKSNLSRGSSHNERGLRIDMNSRDNQQHSNQPRKDMKCYYCHKKRAYGSLLL